MINNYIKLTNDIYDDLSISNEAITILILLYRNYMQYKSLAIGSVQMLADLMRFNINNNRKTITVIKDALSELVTKKYITNVYDLYYKPIQIEKNDNDTDYIRDKDMIFYMELMSPPETNYFQVNDEDLNNIFSRIKSLNINKYNLIRYFAACRRVINNSNKFGYLSQAKLKSLVNDSRTIQGYNKLLQDELHLIRYNNSYLTPDKHYCTTYIGDYNDEEGFNQQVQFEVDNKGLIHTDKIISNKKRSVKQKINNAVLAEKDKEIAELKAQLEALQYKPKEKIKSSSDNSVPNDTWGESAPDNIDFRCSEEDMNNTMDMLIKADDESESPKPISKFSLDDDDLLNSKNPEIDLIKEFLGKYSFRYEKEFDKINEGKLSISFFFNGYCNDADYSDYLKFKENKADVKPVKKSSLTKHIPCQQDTDSFDANNFIDDAMGTEGLEYARQH